MNRMIQDGSAGGLWQSSCRAYVPIPVAAGPRRGGHTVQVDSDERVVQRIRAASRCRTETTISFEHVCRLALSCRTASHPSVGGMHKSVMKISGRCPSAVASASVPSVASMTQ